MTLLAVWLRIELRRRWRSLLVLAVLIAVCAGTVFTAVAGARRGATAIDRLLDQTLPATAVVSPFQPGFDWTVVRALPEVEAVTTYPFFTGFGIKEAPGHSQAAFPFVPADGHAMRMIESPVVLDGRLADPLRADEAVVTANFVTSYHRGVGDNVTLQLSRPEERDADLAGKLALNRVSGPQVQVRIVGVVRSPWFSDDAGGTGKLIPSAGLFAQYRENLAGSTGAAPVHALVRLRGGESDLPRFLTDLAQATGRPDIDVANRANFVRHLRDVLGFESAALLAFGIAVLVAGVVLVGQAIARYATGTVADLQALRASGMTFGQAALTAAAGPLLAAVAGTTLAVGCAVLASGSLPFGTATQYEPAPGFDADWLVLGLGWVLVPAVVLAAAVAAAWIAAVSGRSTSGRHSVVGRAVAKAAVPVPVVVGTRFALEPGSGRSAVPVRPALLGAVTGVLGVLAAFTFSAGVGDAAAHPERFGRTFEWYIPFGQHGMDDIPAAAVLTAVAADPDVVGTLDFRIAAAESGPTSVILFSYRTFGGPVPIVLTQGAMAQADDEVVLAPTTARLLGAGVGATVPFTGDVGTAGLRVTGIGFVPEAYTNGYDEGAWVTAGGYDRLFAGFKEHGGGIALRPGADPTAVVPRLQRAAGAVRGGEGLGVVQLPAPQQFAEIQNVRVLPVVLGAFLALLAIGAVGHALVTAVRRRRYDVAVLRAVGMTPWQARGVVITQASVLAVIGLLFGIPLGLALGRTLWRVVADSTPLLYVPPVAVVALVLIVPLALLIANLLAASPGHRAARLRISQVLRTE